MDQFGMVLTLLFIVLFISQVLVCGDLRGNLIVYPLLKGLLMNNFAKSEVTISPINYFRGAHGISAVSSISIASFCSNCIVIRSVWPELGMLWSFHSPMLGRTKLGIY